MNSVNICAGIKKNTSKAKPITIPVNWGKKSTPIAMHQKRRKSNDQNLIISENNDEGIDNGCKKKIPADSKSANNTKSKK